MVTTIALASTMYGLTTLTACFDSGLAPRTEGTRLLVVANNAPTAEAVPDLRELPSFAGLAAEFDRVVSFNETIAPFHPSSWEQGLVNSPLWERALRSEWGIGDEPVRLVVESIQVRPARTLTEIFVEAPVSVYADGLMSYGPTRRDVGYSVGRRLQELWYPNLVDGLDPMLLSEYSISLRSIPLDVLRRRLESLASTDDHTEFDAAADGERRAIVVGQYLSSLGLMTPESEFELTCSMIEKAAAAGATSVFYKPHPGEIAEIGTDLATHAAEVGVRFEIVTSRSPVESLVPLIQPEFVVGCFSTALFTCWAMFGVRPISVGTRSMLAALRPYSNSNRIPLVLADAMIAHGDRSPGESTSSPTTSVRIETLTSAVGFLMQPELHGDRESRTKRDIERGLIPAEYFEREHLTMLRLPGGDPLRRIVRQVSRHPRLRRPARLAYRTLGRSPFGESLRSRISHSSSTSDLPLTEN